MSPAPPACPTCGKPRVEAHRPFCSRRCADVDLQRWFAGAYAVPAEEADEQIPRPGEPAPDA